MPQVKNSRIVQYPLPAIYAVVFDIKSYPQLLSFIREVTIIEQNAASMVARVGVGLPMLNFSYDCLIAFEKDVFIKITLVSGPLKKLNALWQFSAIDDAHTKIDYMLDAAFKNPLAELTAGAIFASQLDHAIDAFEAKLRQSQA